MIPMAGKSCADVVQARVAELAQAFEPEDVAACRGVGAAVPKEDVPEYQEVEFPVQEDGADFGPAQVGGVGVAGTL
jgi:hypothetical protein